MYSLYRAWLSLGPCGTLQSSAPLQLPGAPDVALQVGPTLTHFSAHRAVLATHSGYFKAALSTHAGHGAIAVPNVNVDEFSSLLTFMYTGFLDLNINNIYNILLATHILHMPRALELCRNYLIQQHPIENGGAAPEVPRPSAGVIKPIPSRKLLPHHQQLYQPILGGFSSLQSSEATPFRAVEKVQDGAPERKPAECAPSTSKELSSPTLELADTTTSANPPVAAKPQPQKHPKPKKRPESSSTSFNSKTSTGQDPSDKTIIDIACCDGPVRFHRVINNNYGLSAAESAEVATATTSSEKEVTQRNDAMNKAMTMSINSKKLLYDENASSGGSTSDLFTCVYCNHTFKSQYCYQKHARRHLNPVTLEAGQAPPKAAGAVASAEGAKREVKLLDMNVQYYPCKTCGSKFPSYYFVHKHRKLCHAEEMQQEQGKQVAPAAPPAEESSEDKHSTIDVVETSN